MVPGMPKIGSPGTDNPEQAASPASVANPAPMLDLGPLVEAADLFETMVYAARNDTVFEAVLDFVSDMGTVVEDIAHNISARVAQTGRGLPRGDEKAALRDVAGLLLHYREAWDAMPNQSKDHSQHFRSLMPERLDTLKLVMPISGLTDALTEDFHDTEGELRNYSRNLTYGSAGELCTTVNDVLVKLPHFGDTLRKAKAGLAKAENNSDVLELSGLVMFAPDIIEPLKHYSERTTRVFGEMAEAIADVTVEVVRKSQSVIQERTHCKLKKQLSGGFRHGLGALVIASMFLSWLGTSGSSC